MALKYKVGDKVRIKSLDWYNKNKDEYDYIDFGKHMFYPPMSKYCGEVFTIDYVYSDFYTMNNNDFEWTDEMIEGLVEKEMTLDKAGQITDFEYEGLAYTLPEGYQFVDENGNVINATKIVLEKKKKEYPKTFEECVHVLEGENRMSLEQMNTFRKLIDARNAYWKLYGEEMGLGKPWEPKWTSFLGYPAIYMYRYQITLSVAKDEHHLLVFPTEEMRDAFYKNFKSEIERCKELL